jgi:hypothetical protein
MITFVEMESSRMQVPLVARAVVRTERVPAAMLPDRKLESKINEERNEHDVMWLC